MKVYIKNIVISCISFSLGAVVFDIFPYSPNKYGTLADWISGVGTICAFLVVFWQIKKEADIQRAMEVESHRPRFAVSVMLASEITLGNTVFIGSRKAIDKLKEELRGMEGANEFMDRSNPTNKFLNFTNYYDRNYAVLKNISKNNIYSIAVEIKYLKDKSSKSQIIEYSGIRPYENIVLLTDNDLWGEKNKCESIVVKFVSSANEIGFFDFESSESSWYKYSYVKSKNKSVSAYGMDKMISENSNEYESLNFNVENGEASYSYWEV